MASRSHRVDGSGSAEITWLLQLLDEAFHKPSWHGPNLKGSLRRVTLAQALYRPAAHRHSIWEYALHAAYWKYAARRRLLGDPRGSFPRRGSNWVAHPDCRTATEADWKRDRNLLDEQHRLLRDAVSSLDPALLTMVPRGAKVTNAQLIRGVALHDVYHAGQIQLLKRLAGSGQ
jgi:uncharacterized damage-inducible protein DinB